MSVNAFIITANSISSFFKLANNYLNNNKISIIQKNIDQLNENQEEIISKLKELSTWETDKIIMKVYKFLSHLIDFLTITDKEIKKMALSEIYSTATELASYQKISLSELSDYDKCLIKCIGIWGKSFIYKYKKEEKCYNREIEECIKTSLFLSVIFYPNLVSHLNRELIVNLFLKINDNDKNQLEHPELVRYNKYPSNMRITFLMVHYESEKEKLLSKIKGEKQ